MSRGRGAQVPSRWLTSTLADVCFPVGRDGPASKAFVQKDDVVPPKIRDLVGELERAGFVDRSGKGSHRNFVHQNVAKPITLSGGLGDDAKHYQVRAVKRAVEESRS